VNLQGEPNVHKCKHLKDKYIQNNIREPTNIHIELEDNYLAKNTSLGDSTFH